MKRIFTFLFLFLFVATISFAQVIEKQELDRNGNPTFVKFDTKSRSYTKSETKAVLSSIFEMTKNDEYKSLRSEKDQIGITHERFQQYYKGIKVENGIYIVHSRNGAIESLSGEYKLIQEINVTPGISLDDASKKAKEFVNAAQYMSSENKAMQFDPELVVVAYDYGKHPKDVHEMVLAYKIDVYATKPLSRAFIYVNAHTGEIVHINTLIKNAAATGTAYTRYSGTKSISTDSYNSSYRLRDYTRGNGIITYDCNTSTSYTSAVDFTDANNSWTAAEYDNSAKDNGALDAHWAGMMTYDYFTDVHGRNSFDGNGALMKTYVHFDSNYDNAYWNGSVFTFGDGSDFDILTSLDVFGHEFGHAVCSYTADLTYQNESGALNEAFSDIWGCAIENRYAPEKDNWLMGEDLGSALRSISDPKSKNLPDTYMGDNWYPLASSPSQYNDYGGVHFNNGPFCYWFYLISVGGSGTNDNGDAYNVTTIGIDKAEKIAYRIESVYMTASSNYANARTYAIQAAQDLYGAGSQEEISVTNAMYAIGVGDAYGGTTPNPSAEYCESKGSDFSYEWIASVAFGSFTKTSGGTAYSDYTSSVIEVNAGDTYNVTLTPGFASTTYNEYFKIWIDYNNDTTFDASELVYDAGALSKVAVSGTVTIPTGISGVRRMRVSMKYNAAQTACETFSYGEVEDYHVNIGNSGTDTQAPAAPTGLSSSSITETTFTLSWNAATDNVGVTGYDVYSNGSLLGSVTGTSANITGLTASTTYAMTVKAKDAAGNVSSASSALNVTTAAVVDTQAPTVPTNLSSSNITSSSVSLSWSASTDNIGVAGYDVYRNGSLLTTTTSTSYNVTVLSASTTYTFYVKAKDAAGNVSSASSTISVTTSDVVSEYCTSKGNNFSYEWISKIVVGTFTNSSTSSGYTDFTSKTISLTAGTSVNVALTPGFSGSTYNEYWKIWIDYNNDAIFADSELAFDAGALSKTEVSGTISVPSTASGTTRMRISMKYNAAQTACETFSYGEVEDYTVTFGASVPDTQAPTVPTGLSSSNITSSSATISWNASTDNVGVTGYEVYRNGSLVNTVTSTSYNANGLTAGTTYAFTIKAKDAAGNKSTASNALSVKTLTTSTANLTLTITFDNYPEETSWTLKNSGGSTVASGGTYASQADGSTLVISIDDLADDCYVFTILDAYGDGICCSYGSGSYSLEVDGGSVLASGGSFTSSEVTNFCLPNTTYGFNSASKNVIDIVDGKSTVNVYPNPASTFINIDVINGHRVGMVRIYNTVGTLVKSLDMNGSEKEIDISELPTGLYIISIEDEKEPLFKQFIKQ